MLAVGLLMVYSTDARLAEYSLNASQIEQIAPTFFGLGVSDGLGSLFSFVAMVLVYRGSPNGRILALTVGAYHVLAGLSLFVLTAGDFALYFVIPRGVIIMVAGWGLTNGEPRAA